MRLTNPSHHATLQVGAQPATEALPLVMEPGSRMYCDPLVVLVGGMRWRTFRGPALF